MSFALTSSADFFPRPLRKWGPYFLLVLAVFVAYGNSFDNAFLYDDESLILKNAFLLDWHHIGAIFSTQITAGAKIDGGFYRPMQIFLYLIVYQLAGASSLAFHLLNISLHAANACLVLLLGRKLRFQPLAVFFAALLWALHPMQVEAVVYMSGTADPLFVFFTLIGLAVLLPRFKPEQFYIAVPFFILALLSKEEAIIFPALAMCCIFLLDKERFDPKTYTRTWPLWATAVVYLIAHKFLLSFSDFHLYRLNDVYANSVMCRIYTFLATLPTYLGFIAWPLHLRYDRDFQPVLTPWHLSVLGGLAMVAAGAAQVALGRTRRALALSWGLLWFAVAHALHTGILSPVNSMLLEHWLYLPSVGLFLGTAQSLAAARSLRWQQRKPTEAAIASLLAIVLGGMTAAQNTIWRDPEAFYLNIFKNGEPSPHAHNNLGIVYALRGDYRKSLEQFDLSIMLSGDTNATAHHDLAIELINGPNGDHYTQEAIKNLRRAIEIEPDYIPALAALSAMYDRIGDRENAVYYHLKAEEARKKFAP